MLRVQAESLAAGRIEEAALRARRVLLLRAVMAQQVRAQVPGVAAGDRRFPREGPLVEALNALAPDADMERRHRALRVLDEASPERVELVGQEVLVARPVAPAANEVDRSPSWRVRPVGPPGPDGEQAHRLSLVGPEGRALAVGTVWSGVLGRSWDVSRDGRVAVVARPDERLLERWDLSTGRATVVALPHAPRTVVLPPDAADGRTAWGAARVQGAVVAQELYLQEGPRSRRIFPPPGTTAAALGCEWDPGGKTLLVRWAERWPHDAGEHVHLMWLTTDGRQLLRAWYPLGPHTPPVRWVPGPGAWIGLATTDAAWAWDGKAATATPLPGVRGAWGWSPRGRLLAGIDVGHLFVAAAADPRRRREFKLAGLAPYFVPDAAGLVWDAEGVRIEGRAAEQPRGPWHKVRISARLAIADRP